MHSISSVKWLVLITFLCCVLNSANGLLEAQTIKIDSVPYQVSVRYSGGHICGGSIITDRFVLSAAHCSKEGPLKDHNYKIRVGSSFWNSGGAIYELLKFIKHPEYNPNDYSYDFMLLNTELSIKFGPSATAISMAENDDNNMAGQGYVSGWGFYKYVQDKYPVRPDQLQGMTMTIETCSGNYMYQKAYSICLENIYGKAICPGDSGGPLTKNKLLIGVASIGANSDGICVSKGSSVYTRVSLARKWVIQMSSRDAKLSEIINAINNVDFSKAIQSYKEYQGMFTQDPVFVSDVIQKAFVDIKTDRVVKTLKFVDGLGSDVEKASGFITILNSMMSSGEFKTPQVFEFSNYLQRNIANSANPPRLDDVRKTFMSAVKSSLKNLINSITNRNKWSESLRYYNADQGFYLLDLCKIIAAEAAMYDMQTTLDFVVFLTVPDHKFYGLRAVWEKTYNNVNNPITILMAYQMKQEMLTAPKKLKNYYTIMKEALPNSLQAIIWEQKVRIKNVMHNDFMYSPDKGFDFDIEGKFVFNWKAGTVDEQSYWRFETSDEGRTFLIYNLFSKQYMYAASNTYDRDRRYVLTFISGKVPMRSKWIIALTGQDLVTIKNEFYQEYLFTSSYTFKDDGKRERIFTWIPKTIEADCFWKIIGQ